MMFLIMEGEEENQQSMPQPFPEMILLVMDGGGEGAGDTTIAIS